jgi:MFS family permease
MEARESLSRLNRFQSRFPIILASAFLPILLYVILRPENYSLTPNSLDPIFYSGYAINFDDILQSVGGRHYFVSRWSSYLLANFANFLAGPIAGRLLLRLALSSVLISFVWSFGKRFSWNWAQRVLVGTLLVTTPMFLRAFFTEYVEYFIVAFGTILVCLVLKPNPSSRRAVGVGVLAALLCIANLIAISMVVPCLAIFLFGNSINFRRRIYLAMWIGISGSVVVFGGYLLFHFFFGIDNVYYPTWRFLRTFQVQNPDPWRSPNLRWLGAHTWIYAAPFVVATGLLAAWRSRIPLDRIQKLAFFLCLTQWIYQWFDQFVRLGYGLELSFYWSFSLPSFLVALCFVAGNLTRDLQQRSTIVLTLLWLVLLLAGVPNLVRLPRSTGFAAVSAVVLIAIALAVRRYIFWSAFAALMMLGWMQIGAPKYDPLLFMKLDNRPKYDKIIRQSGNLSETVYHEAIWFSNALDKIPNDSETSFVVLSTWASAVTGLYAPQVTGRIITLNESSTQLTEVARSEVLGGFRPIIAVYGPPLAVQDMLSEFRKDLPLGSFLLDETNPDGLHYRLVAFRMATNTKFPFRWTADLLQTTSGRRVATEVQMKEGDQVGFVTFGPYVPLPVGRYQATVVYRSTAEAENAVGLFDVSSVQFGTTSATPITGTKGASGSVAIDFDVSKKSATNRWEFRTMWNGTGDFAVEHVEIDRLGDPMETP